MERSNLGNSSMPRLLPTGSYRADSSTSIEASQTYQKIINGTAKVELKSLTGPRYAQAESDTSNSYVSPYLPSQTKAHKSSVAVKHRKRGSRNKLPNANGVSILRVLRAKPHDSLTHGSPQDITGSAKKPDLDGFTLPCHHSSRPECIPAKIPSFPASSDASPMAPPQLALKQCRLPPSTIGHKAPRNPMCEPTRFVESEQKVVKRNTAPETARTRSPIRKWNNTSPPPSPSSGRRSPKDIRTRKKQCTSAVTFPAGSKKARASRDVHNPVTNRKSMNNGYDKIDSPTTSDGSYHDPKEKQPVPSPVTRGHARGKKQLDRPQPRFEYAIPEELFGVVRALGQDDWTEYIILAEKYALKEKTETDFDTVSRRMFHVTDAKLRVKIQSMVISLVRQKIEGEGRLELS
ncbi:hypothetical protein EJ07DRAFT_172146 [Lizonia empirigonia]|nr:hypothetical protein EJ07DRAFT_172146 [Lizonia empirigonia]